MKVVYFGTDVFLPCFEYFLKEHKILALYTYHNNEDYFMEYSIIKMARKNGIPVYYEEISTEAITRYFREEGCELFFVAEYNRIIDIPDNFMQFRGINVHSSILPQGRSYYPIEAAFERGLDYMGVTLHKITKKLDAGDILAQKKFKLEQEMDSIDIYMYCSLYARNLIEEIINNLDKYWENAKKQTKVFPYWKRPDIKKMILNHEMEPEEARLIYKKYNCMTIVEADNKWFYVSSLKTGIAPLYESVRWLSSDQLLYRVKNGHLRLNVKPLEG